MIISTDLERLNSTNSTNEKLEILKNISKETKEFFRVCYNPRIVFGIKKIPKYENISNNITLEKAIEFLLDNLATRKITGNKAIEALSDLLSNCEEPKTLEKLIKRNAECGVNVSLLNKAFGKDFIKEIPCMLAQPMNPKTISKIKFPAISQLKCDGMRCIIIKENNTINAFSRNGSPLEITHILDKIKTYNKDNFIVDCEIIGLENNEVMSRQVSNGLCNKLIRNTISENELLKLGIQVWDFIESEYDKTPYNKRFEKAQEFVKTLDDNSIQLVESKIVNSLDEAKEHFNEKVSQGLEGIILKNLDNIWENKRSNDLVKFKEELTIDLKVVDVIEGTGEFEGGLGAIVCETECGKLKVNIGTGFSLEERGLQNDLSDGKKKVIVIEDFEKVKSRYLGEIVEVMYNAIIEDKNSGVKSLFLPRLIKIRKDKSVANSLSEV